MKTLLLILGVSLLLLDDAGKCRYSITVYETGEPNTETSRRLAVAVANYITGRSMKCVRVAQVIEHDVTPIAIVCSTPPVDEDDYN